MPRPPRLKTCAIPDCWQLTTSSRCGYDCHPGCKQADKRGPGRAKDYGSAWRKVRDPFIKAHPRCVGVNGEHHPNCNGVAVVPDHWPESRRSLVARGVPDPDAWHRLQALSMNCHGWKGVRFDGLWGRRGAGGAARNPASSGRDRKSVV